MTLRTTTNPLIRGAGRTLTRLNARHPWSHNQHFHPWVLRSLPAVTGRVLDVGCGRGDLLAELARRTGRVDGIDPDQEMAYVAASRFQDDPRVHVWRRGLAEHAATGEVQGAYDAITMIASLHHMDPEQALVDARRLLRPGGRLLVVTLTDPVGAVDRLWELTNALTNPLIGLVKHPRPVREPAAEAPIPVKDPELTLGALREQAGRHLPGAVLRRREGFRVTMSWQKPGSALDED
jgi:SAM-dependent methyltransferase